MVRTRLSKGLTLFDRLVAACAVGSGLLVLPFAAMSDSDAGGFFYLVDVLFVGVVLSIVAAVRKQIVTTALLIAYLLASWASIAHFGDLHVIVKWQLQRSADRVAVMSQSASSNHDLKHIEWDGWGFAGMETEAYLVYDPTDSLAPAAESAAHGKFAGIPCDVWQIRRLEGRFYAVVFYTDTDWNHCTY